jgi:hypothetical protein
MKTLLACLSLVFCFAATTFAQSIEFEAKEIDYGTIEKGANGVRVFKFTNTGSAPLIINSAKGSCGCTVPSYAKEPIMPGESSEIKVKYDTKRVGAFTKYVTLTTNATNETTTRLKIFGKVEPEAAPTPAKEKSLFDQ